MVRPLRWIGADNVLREFTDADLTRLSYDLRVAYADYIVNGNLGATTVAAANRHGSLVVGGTAGTDIGNSVDSRRTRGVASNTGPGRSHPGTPAVGNAANVTTTYRRLTAGVPAAPTNAELDDDSYLSHNGGIFRTTGTNGAGDFNELFTHCLGQMRTGDEVGTYRVGTAAPTNGTWNDRGVWFNDTTFTGSGAAPAVATTTYNLYMCTAAAAVPGNVVGYHRWEGNGVVREITDYEDLIDNVLLPLFIPHVDNNLTYDIATGGGANRGTWLNRRRPTTATRQTQTTGSAPNQTYTSFGVPLGAATTVTTYRLTLA